MKNPLTWSKLQVVEYTRKQKTSAGGEANGRRLRSAKQGQSGGSPTSRAAPHGQNNPLQRRTRYEQTVHNMPHDDLGRRAHRLCHDRAPAGRTRLLQYPRCARRAYPRERQSDRAARDGSAGRVRERRRTGRTRGVFGRAPRGRI